MNKNLSVEHLRDTLKIYEPDTVYLMPTPSTAGVKVYFTFSSPKYAAPGDVEDIHGPPYYAWAKKCLHESSGFRKRGS